MPVVKWFKPGRATGWAKTQAPATRRRKLMASTSRALKPRKRYVQAARRAMALGNVTKDPPTKRKAVADARYFYAKADKAKRK